MSRPPALPLIEHVDKATYRTDQIIPSAGIWAVYYDDQPFNFKSFSHKYDVNATPKYKKTSFSNPGHARNLCRKLNKQFNTDKFSVVYLTEGRKIYPE